MITITIPFIPFLLAISIFIISLLMEIDESDRFPAFVISVIVSTICFFASYGLFMVLCAF